MKNKKFLGILMALGLTFSLTLATSAATLLPSTDSINVSYEGKSLDESNKHFFKGTDLKDVVALHILFDRALEKPGKQNKLAYEGLKMQTMVPYGMFDKQKQSPVYLDPKIPTEIDIDLTGKDGEENFQGLNLEGMKNKIQELNKQNSEFIAVLNKEKNSALTQEEFKKGVEKIKKLVKESIDLKHYHHEEEKEKLEKILKEIDSVKFEDVKNIISKFNFGVKEAIRHSEEDLAKINKSLKEGTR